MFYLGGGWEKTDFLMLPPSSPIYFMLLSPPSSPHPKNSDAIKHSKTLRPGRWKENKNFWGEKLFSQHEARTQDLLITSQYLSISAVGSLIVFTLHIENCKDNKTGIYHIVSE